MLIQFRQGLVQVQSPSFFKVTFPYVDLMVTDTNPIVAFAAGTKDYLYTEQASVTQAWGPLHLGRDQWLYWDIDVRNGHRTFGITLHEPVISHTAPNAPTTDQHWFDLSSGNMMIWTGHAWSKRIRTFAMKLINGRIPVSMCINSPTFIGTQVGITGPTYAGHIMFDATTKNALRDASGGFITTEDRVSTKSVSLSEVKLASIIIEGEAQQNMAAHTVVVFSEFGKIVHADQYTAEQTRHFGMIETSAVTGQTVQVTSHGMISSPDWDWSAAGVNALLYCDAAGALITTPVIPGQIPVAEVLDRHTIILGSPIVQAEGGADVALATQDVFGISRLSVPAENESDPIVVGDNDPRLTNARPPAYHTHPIEQVILLPEALDDKVDVAGDTMTGFLSLNEDPIEPLHAVTKQYVDNRTVWAAGRQYQVQYNMAGKFAASDALTLYPGTENAPTVALLDLGSYNFELAVLHSPKTLQVEAGGTQDGLSYPLILQGGGSLASGDVVGDQSIRAGDVIVRGGLASSNVENASFGGDACIYGGNGYTTNGDVNIRGGEEQEDGTFNSFANGGHVYISGGSVGNTKVAGDVNISGGSARPGGAGVAGNVRLHTNGYERLRINNTGEWVLNGSGVGTPGQVLVSQGADQPPTWGYATAGALGAPINTLLAATGSNHILNGSHTQHWAWGATNQQAYAGLQLESRLHRTDLSYGAGYTGQTNYVYASASGSQTTQYTNGTQYGDDISNPGFSNGTTIPQNWYCTYPGDGADPSSYESMSAMTVDYTSDWPSGRGEVRFSFMFVNTSGDSTITGGSISVMGHTIDPASDDIFGYSNTDVFDGEGMLAGVMYDCRISYVLYPSAMYNINTSSNQRGRIVSYDIIISTYDQTGNIVLGPQANGSESGLNHQLPISVSVSAYNYHSVAVNEGTGTSYSMVDQYIKPSVVDIRTHSYGHDALSVSSGTYVGGQQPAFVVTATGRVQIGGHLVLNHSPSGQYVGTPGKIVGEPNHLVTTLVDGGRLDSAGGGTLTIDPYTARTVQTNNQTGTVRIKGGNLDNSFLTTSVIPGRLIEDPDLPNIIARGGEINLTGGIVIDAGYASFGSAESSSGQNSSAGGLVLINGGDANPLYYGGVGGGVYIRGGHGSYDSDFAGSVLLESGGYTSYISENDPIPTRTGQSSVIVSDYKIGFTVGGVGVSAHENNEDIVITRLYPYDLGSLRLLVRGDAGTTGQVLTSGGDAGALHWADAAAGGGSSLDGVTGYPITALGIGAGTNVRSYAPSNSPWAGESTAIGTNAMNAVTSASSGNVALGTDTLRYSSRAQYNTAVGTRSLATINDAIIGTVSYASPSHNTALGFRTLEAVQCVQWRDHGTELPFNMIASKNVCVGSNAGSELLRSAGGVAIGYSAMRSGSVMFNVAIGSEAMRYCTNITTDTNTSQTREVVERAGDVAIGPNAMRGAAPAYDYTLSLPGTRSSVAIGMNSMANKAAQSSVAVGYATLSQTTSTAVNSVAVGVSALQVCGAGVNNTAVGYKSLQMLTSGSNNVAIGNLAGQDAVANLTTQSNYVVLGNNSTTNANIKVAWTVTSDARDKTEIAPIPVGLEFINQLSPKQFKLMDRETQQPTTGIRYGFIAQDVLSAEGDDPVIVDVTDINNLKLRESLIVPALVKAVQELSAEIALLKSQLHNLTH